MTRAWPGSRPKSFHCTDPPIPQHCQANGHGCIKLPYGSIKLPYGSSEPEPPWGAALPRRPHTRLSCVADSSIALKEYTRVWPLPGEAGLGAQNLRKEFTHKLEHGL